jgi:hypothetical protein
MRSEPERWASMRSAASRAAAAQPSESERREAMQADLRAAEAEFGRHLKQVLGRPRARVTRADFWDGLKEILLAPVFIISMVVVTFGLMCFQILTWPLRVVIQLVCLVTGRSVLTGRPYRHHRHDPEIYVTRQQRAAFTRKMNREAQRRAQEKGRST